MTKINIPETGQERIVVVGGGFAGLSLARKLAHSNYQIVLIDKNNYHQFQPLFYQVAMAGLEPSSIVFPLRKLFQKRKNVFIRVTEVSGVDLEHKRLQTPLGIVNYDQLVLAMGAETNFFGNEHIAQLTIPMKSVSEALFLRNQILADYEEALTNTDFEQRQGYVDIVIVGGGPTGVEVAGALAEMKKYILPKDYPELNAGEVDIYLIQGASELLKGMSLQASQKAFKFLTDLGVKIILNTRVSDYDGEFIYTDDGNKIRTRKVIWAAGITCNRLPGIPRESIVGAGRIKTDEYHHVEGLKDVYAIGDLAFMATSEYPNGHPQVAQVAIQQAKNLAKNFRRKTMNAQPSPFRYRDLGAMATIGRNRAVVDLPRIKLQGSIAWFIWLFVHLFNLLGVKNRLFVFLNWVWNYFTYDQSLRLIIRPYLRSKKTPSDLQK